MKNKISRFGKFGVFAVTTLIGLAALPASAELKVVTTLPIFADIAKEIGRERINVESIVPPKKGFAFYQESPEDISKMRNADLLIHSGVGAETWLARVIEKSGKADFKANGSRQLGLSAGIPLLQTPAQLRIEKKHSPFHSGNPFYALSPKLGLVVASSIADKFSTLDPAGAAAYKSNLAALKADLEPKIASWTAAAVSAKGKKLVGYKFEGVYLADFLGMHLKDAVIEEIVEKPSVSDIQNIVKEMSRYKIPAILTTESSSKEIPAEIAKATSAKVVTICENVGDLPPCANYVALLAYNVDAVTKAATGK